MYIGPVRRADPPHPVGAGAPSPRADKQGRRGARRVEAARKKNNLCGVRQRAAPKHRKSRESGRGRAGGAAGAGRRGVSRVVSAGVSQHGDVRGGAAGRLGDGGDAIYVYLHVYIHVLYLSIYQPPDASETAVMRYMCIYMCTYMYYIYLSMSRWTPRRRR